MRYEMRRGLGKSKILSFWVFGLLCVWEVWEVGREERGVMT